jgi:hypothetical protein
MSMRTGVLTERITGASPRLKAGIAGVFYLFAVLMAAFGEVFLRGRSAASAGLMLYRCDTGPL